MRLFLDTQVLIWSVDGSPRLGAATRDLLTDLENELLVSVISIWEAAIKIRIGKLEGQVARLLEELPRLEIELIDLRPVHLSRLMELPRLTRHRDPFDQLLLAQAAAEAATFLSADRALAGYGVALLDATQ